MARYTTNANTSFGISTGAAQRPKMSDYTKIRVGGQTLTGDIAVNPDWDKRSGRPYTLQNIKDIINRNNPLELRQLSRVFFATSGIYSRLCRYMAYLYRYDHFVTPIIFDEKIADKKVIEGWMKSAAMLDNSNLKQTFGDIALKVIRDGCYYGYKLPQKTAGYIQELPAEYCRSRYMVNGQPAVEFHLKYFDDKFTDSTYRAKVLKIFPLEIQKAYVSWKKGKLPVDFQGDSQGWFLLTPGMAIKFNLGTGDFPIFAPVIPNIVDLEEAKDLDKERMKQQLLRIIVQEMPIDINGDPVFELDDTQQLHANAVAMLGKAIGVNVLTTFADVSSIDMSDKGNVSSVDQLDKVERSVYNEAGVSQMQFNTSTNLALEKSIANDEATMTNLLLQFERYAESLLSPFNKNPKRLYYTVQILPTTIYNYKDLSKIYKEQTQIGFSKLLPQVALGQSQLVVMNTALFENQYMNLDELFVPPRMSSTMSGADNTGDSDTGGRPKLPDEEKSDKTILNEESG